MKRLNQLANKLGLVGEVQRIDGGYQYYNRKTCCAHWLGYTVSGSAKEIEMYAWYCRGEVA